MKLPKNNFDDNVIYHFFLIFLYIEKALEKSTNQLFKILTIDVILYRKMGKYVMIEAPLLLELLGTDIKMKTPHHCKTNTFLVSLRIKYI